MKKRRIGRRNHVRGEPSDAKAAQKRFIELLLDGYIHKVALRQSGLEWSVVSQWLHRDADFAQRYDFARLAGYAFNFMRVQEAAYDRAIKGWEEPLLCKGRVIGRIRRYSDRLLIELLRMHDPERYGPGTRRRIQ
jgi:hypothetical protein